MLVAVSWGQEGHISIRILPTMVSGILLVFGHRTRKQDPYVYWSLGTLASHDTEKDR